MDRVAIDVSLRSWSSTCCECRKACDTADAKELGLGHVMHQVCYERWLTEFEAEAKPRSHSGKDRRAVVLLPGEETLSREGIARRRTEMLFGRRPGADGSGEL
jgi:hypothetical protein